MLVLQRKQHECIDITLPDGRVIVLRVVEFRNTLRRGELAVRFGIEAPSDVTIHRREITERINAIQQELGDDHV